MAEENESYRPLKRRRLDLTPPDTAPKSEAESEAESEFPITHWIKTAHWPKSYFTMNKGRISPLKRSRVTTTQSSHPQKVIAALEAYGIKTDNIITINPSIQEYCSLLFQGNLTPKTNEQPALSFNNLTVVLGHISSLGEARLTRDITPWVCPSPETLWLTGTPNVPNYIGEELDILWSQCLPMGSSIPKPDMTIGLLPSKAFTEQEYAKIVNYTCVDRATSVTHRLAFPFLVVEVKSGDNGLSQARRQNKHSASIAVKTIIDLYKTALPQRVQELYGQVLCFSIAHNDEAVQITSHFASPEGSVLRYCFHDICQFQLIQNEGTQRYSAYNFVCNLYSNFVPKHVERIKAALAAMPTVQVTTGLSFAASSLSLTESGEASMSNDNSESGEAGTSDNPEQAGDGYPNKRIHSPSPSPSPARGLSLQLQVNLITAQLRRELEAKEKEREEREKQREEREKQKEDRLMSMLKEMQEQMKKN